MTFRDAYKELQPEPQKRKKAMDVIGQEIDRKKICCRLSPPELFLTQLKYISPIFWLLQGAVLAAGIFFLCGTSLRQGQLRDYLSCGSVAAAWLGLVACGESGRHLTRGMAELEQSCYFNFSQLWTMRMILSGSMDIMILCIYCGVIARNTHVRVMQIGVYLLVPFVFSNAVYLAFLTFTRGARLHYSQIILAAVSAAAATIPGLVEEVYAGENLWIWVVLLVAGVVFQAELMRQCYRKMTEGEILCWN